MNKCRCAYCFYMIIQYTVQHLVSLSYVRNQSSTTCVITAPTCVMLKRRVCFCAIINILIHK